MPGLLVRPERECREYTKLARENDGAESSSSWRGSS